MDLQSRKIAFVQDFLELDSEADISVLEDILVFVKTENGKKDFARISKEELNRRMDQAEADFENRRFTCSGELLSKYHLSPE